MFGFGGAQLIHRYDDGYAAASDHRKDGCAIGF
jgi:gamma-glutamyltranspeptidase/glutathione hydrolase